MVFSLRSILIESTIGFFGAERYILSSITLSVLDQSYTPSFDEAPLALQQTLEMARHCESLGFHRFWVSEHHAFHALAGSVPEILIAALGAATSSIRLGSGGIMLPHYSAYKVAETFSLLANLYPERIDLGLGRAPGAEMSTAVALAADGKPNFHRFPDQVDQLLDYLNNPHAKPLVSPKPPANLPVWMLGSSADSATLAAQLGLPYNLGLFINPSAVPSFVEHYRRSFQPGSFLEKPYAMLTVSVFCAEEEAQAKSMQHTSDVNFFLYITGQAHHYAEPGKVLNPEQAEQVPVSAALQGFIDQRNQTRAVGTPEQVAAQLKQLAQQYQADELMLVSNMFYFEERKRCFKLIKDIMAV